MAIAIPQPGNDLDATAFGQPVANAVNSLGAMKLDVIPAIAVSAGAKTTIYTKTITVPPTVLGLFGIVVVGYTTTSVGDLVDPTNKVLAAIPNSGAGCITSFNYVAKVGSTVTFTVMIYAWGSAVINVDGAKSYVSLQPVLQLVTGNVFP
ncbi:MAG: hypothetical protein ABW007_25205 [Chitinophagaceae bacterium]